jgi:predicted transglutaminase-like cysteine proteinase
MIRLIVLSCAALAFAAPAAAAPVASQSDQARAGSDRQASVPVKEKKICRRDIATGSIMAKSICHTRTEWDAMTAQSKSDLQKVRNIELTHQQVGIQR